MDLSVVIPARNVAGTLGDQLDALLPQQWAGEWEVVLVDNGSTDDTVAVARSYAERHPRLRIVTAADGSGVSYVRNRGMEAAASDAIAICDGDDIVGPDWVAAMGDALRSAECVTGPVDVARLNPGWLVRTRGEFPPDRPRELFGAFEIVAGGNVGLRRGTWERVGRFDEGFFGPEDAEFSLRLHRAGVAITFAPGARLHYRYRTGARDLFRQGFHYGLGRPLLSRLVRESGVARPPRVGGWKTWLLLVAWLPRLRTPEGRASYAWVAGNRIGQLAGVARHRAFYL